MPFRAAIEAGVATIMTAHVLVPSLDEERPATLSRRIVSRAAARGAGLRGRDPERRPRDEGDRRTTTPVPAAAVLAIEAGCDGVLICSGDHDTQAAALEALVHAVEDERLPYRARRGRAEAAAAREGAVPGGAASPARPPERRRRCGRCSAATSTARSPTRWRGSL